MVTCLERGADLHMAQLMPLPLTVSCFSKIQIGFAFLVPAHPGSPGKRAVKRVCVCVCVCVHGFQIAATAETVTVFFISTASIVAIKKSQLGIHCSFGKEIVYNTVQ